MNKNNKMFLYTTCVLLVLIVGVLAQSLIRQHQRNQVVAAIKKSVAQADSKQSKQMALVAAINENRSDIEYVRAHGPILNIELLGSKADDGEFCDELLDGFFTEGGDMNVNAFIAAGCAL